MLYVAVILFTLYFIAYNYTLHLERFSTRDVDLVIARYKENLDWLKLLPMPLSAYNKIFVYDKGGVGGAIPGLPKGDHIHVISLPNVGRCDHTYLHHIIHQYHDLAKVTIFLPGSAGMDSKLEHAIHTVHLAQRTRDTVMLTWHIAEQGKSLINDVHDFRLDHWEASNTINRSANPEKNLLKCPEQPFGTWFRKQLGDTPIEAIVYRAMFAVSREHIQRHPVEFYQSFISYLDHHSNPEAGHYMERAWVSLFHPLPRACILSQR